MDSHRHSDRQSPWSSCPDDEYQDELANFQAWLHREFEPKVKDMYLVLTATGHFIVNVTVAEHDESAVT